MRFVLTALILAFLAYGVWKDRQDPGLALSQELDDFLLGLLTAA